MRSRFNQKDYIAKTDLFDALGRVKNAYEEKIKEAIHNGEPEKASVYSNAYFMLKEDLLKELGYPKRNI